MLFAIGSVGFCLLLVAVFLFFIFTEEVERIGLAILGLIAVFATLALWGDFNVVREVIDHPAVAGTFFAGYFVTGAIWSVVKWWFYVHDRRYRYEEGKMKFLKDHGIEGNKIPDDLLAVWKRQCEIMYEYGRNCYGNLNTVPQVHENKARVMHWMMFWPWSVVWTIVSDPIKKLFKHIYRGLRGLLQRISYHAYRGVEDDFRDEPVPSEDGGGIDPSTPMLTKDFDDTAHDRRAK